MGFTESPGGPGVSQSVATAAELPEGSVQTSQPLVGFRPGFAAPLLRGAEGRGSPVEGAYLTVAEAAAMLRVSTATVYKLCARGELVHLRVLNVIRIPAGAIGTTPPARPGARRQTPPRRPRAL